MSKDRIAELESEIKRLRENIECLTNNKWSEIELALADKEAHEMWCSLHGVKSLDDLLARAKAGDALLATAGERPATYDGDPPMNMLDGEREGVEPVAWRYELAHSGWPPERYENWQWHLSETAPRVPEGSVRNLTPLYAAPPPSTTGRLMKAVEVFVAVADDPFLGRDLADDTMPIYLGLMNGNVTQRVFRDKLKVADFRELRAALADAKAAGVKEE